MVVVIPDFDQEALMNMETLSIEEYALGLTTVQYKRNLTRSDA